MNALAAERQVTSSLRCAESDQGLKNAPRAIGALLICIGLFAFFAVLLRLTPVPSYRDR